MENRYDRLTVNVLFQLQVFKHQTEVRVEVQTEVEGKREGERTGIAVGVGVGVGEGVEVEVEVVLFIGLSTLSEECEIEDSCHKLREQGRRRYEIQEE